MWYSALFDLLFLVCRFWLFSGPNLEKKSKARRKMLLHLAQSRGFNRKQSRRRGLDERKWRASMSVWLRMRGFTSSRNGTSTTNGHTLSQTHTHPNPCQAIQQSALLESSDAAGKMEWHSRGELSFCSELASVFIFLTDLSAVFNPGSLGGHGQIQWWWLC